MSYKAIDFMSRSAIQGMNANKNTIVISITSPSTPKLKLSEEYKDVLYVEFDNVTSSLDRENHFPLVQAKSIIEFVEKYEKEAETILVNCMMGESRSAAVAMFLANKFYVELKKEKDVSQHNPWIYRILEKADPDYLK